MDKEVYKYRVDMKWSNDELFHGPIEGGMWVYVKATTIEDAIGIARQMLNVPGHKTNVYWEATLEDDDE